MNHRKNKSYNSGFDNSSSDKFKQGRDIRVIIAKAYKEHAEAILRFVIVRVSHQATAQEITQEVFVRLLKISKKKDWQLDEINLKTYLYKIAKNLIIDYYRVSDRMKLAELSDQLISSEVPLEDMIQLKQDIEKAINYVSELKPLWQEVITLREVQGLSVKEIAIVVGKSSGAVRVILHRARKKIRVKLNLPDK